MRCTCQTAAREARKAALHWDGPPHSEFLEFVAARIVNVYGESEHVDFVMSLRARARHFRALAQQEQANG